MLFMNAQEAAMVTSGYTVPAIPEDAWMRDLERVTYVIRAKTLVENFEREVLRDLISLNERIKRLGRQQDF